jgi:uncharacterized protein YbjQ (UPF0145 family)
LPCSAGTTTQKVIDGYVFKEVVGTPSGKYVLGITKVVYVYTKHQYHRLIQHLDLMNFALHLDNERSPCLVQQVFSCMVGSEYTTTQKVIDGYVFKEVVGTPSGKYVLGITKVVLIQHLDLMNFALHLDNERSPCLVQQVFSCIHKQLL